MTSFEIMLARYEGARIHCLRMACWNPSSSEPCHVALARVTKSTGMEVFLAGLLDDMALAIRQEQKRAADLAPKDGAP